MYGEHTLPRYTKDEVNGVQYYILGWLLIKDALCIDKLYFL